MANDYLSASAPLGGASVREETATFLWSDSFQKQSFFALLGLTALLLYSFWNMLVGTSAFWQDDQYSHGYLVPFIAIYVMWSMRPNPTAQEPPEGMPQETFLGLMPAGTFLKIGAGIGAAITIAGIAAPEGLLSGFGISNLLIQGIGIGIACFTGLAYVLIGQPFQHVPASERWIGLAILVAGYGMRMVAANYYMEPLNRLSFIVALIGAFVMVGGWYLLRWTGAGLGFLLFMYPLPSRVEQPLLLGLQKLAAIASEMVLTIMGMPVIRQGNMIQVDGVPLEVAAACSGLRMVTIFGGFAVACAILIKRPWWDRLVILLSAIPIALIVNITRIVITALVYRMYPENETIHEVIHDYAGLAMMPLAMGLLYLLLKLLATLTTEEEEITGYGGGAVGGAFT